MERPRLTIAVGMAAMVLAALDCSLLRFPLYFAGVFLIALAMQVGLYQWSRSRGRVRRFWVGFEAVGLVALFAYLVYLARSPTPERFLRWLSYVAPMIDGALSHLPLDAYLWLRRHVLINLNRRVEMIEIVALFEIAFGLPMLLLSLIGGLLAAFLGPRRIPNPDAAVSPEPAVIGV